MKRFLEYTFNLLLAAATAVVFAATLYGFFDPV